MMSARHAALALTTLPLAALLACAQPAARRRLHAITPAALLARAQPAARPMMSATPAARRRLRAITPATLLPTLALAALLACAQPAASPTPAPPTPPPTPTAVTPTPTATPAPTATATSFPRTREPTATPTVAPPELQLGAPAPDFQVTRFNGDTLRLSDLRGQVVVLNFWASWCPPCRREMPAFQQAWLGSRDDGVVFVGLATGDIEADARAFAAQVGVTYPLGLDLDGAIANRYLVRVMPTTYFIDRDGLLQRKLSGFVNLGVLKVFIAGQTQ